MKKLISVLIFCFLLSGCFNKSGEIIKKEFIAEHYRNGFVYNFAIKVMTPRKIKVKDSWFFELKRENDIRVIEVKEEIFNKYEVGDYYDSRENN